MRAVSEGAGTGGRTSQIENQASTHGVKQKGLYNAICRSLHSTEILEELIDRKLRPQTQDTVNK